MNYKFILLIENSAKETHPLWPPTKCDVLVLIGVTETLKLCPVCINANEIQEMAGFREGSESRGQGNGSNEPVIICRNKGQQVLAQERNLM